MRGNQAVAQYFPPVRDMFDNLKTCPEKFLLWFHRCGWDYRTKSGKTLWDALCEKYYQGAAEAAAMQTDMAIALGSDRSAAPPRSRGSPGDSGGRRREVARPHPPVFPGVQQASDRADARHRRFSRSG